MLTELRMGALPADEFKQLASTAGPCLTIVQPLLSDHTHPGAIARTVRNVTNNASYLLGEKLVDDTIREELLQPLYQLVKDTDWGRPTGTLVAFCARNKSVITVWPELLAPHIHYGDEFYLLPLLPWIQAEGDFWLLGLSAKAVHLFHGSPRGLVEIALPPNVPRSLVEAEQMDTPDRMMQARSSVGKSARGPRRMQFSTATTREKETQWLHDFFKAVDQGIRPVLNSSGFPLIVAAVSRELAIYREVNSYEGILTGAIHGNPDKVGHEFLHTRALALMRARAATQRSRAFAEREEAAATSRFLSDIDAILNAAEAGNNEKMFISDALPTLNRRSALVNKALVNTWRHGGEVIVFAANGREDLFGALLRVGSPLPPNAPERLPAPVPV
jgi:hypothetical protein